MAPTGTGTRGREAKRLAAITLLAAGLAYDEIASRLGVSKRSLVRWNQDPAFADEVRRARAKLLEQLTGRLAAEASSTVDVLVRLRDGAKSEATRLGACRAILERAASSFEQVDLEARLGALEAALAPRSPQQPQRRFTVLGGAPP